MANLRRNYHAAVRGRRERALARWQATVPVSQAHDTYIEGQITTLTEKLARGKVRAW